MVLMRGLDTHLNLQVCDHEGPYLGRMPDLPHMFKLHGQSTRVPQNVPNVTTQPLPEQSE